MTFLQKISKSVLKTGTVATVGCLGDVAGYIDTGSYAFNALVSASLYKGIPSNKITGYSGKSGVGKTYFALQAVKHHLEAHPENVVIYVDTEAAITQEMLESRDLPLDRIVVKCMSTIEEFRTKAFKLIKEYGELQDDKSEPRLLMILDSMGNLSSIKELEDVEKGDNKVDMTKAKLLKATFRALTITAAEENVPILLTNHTYDSIGLFPATNQAGGSGMVYAASTIIVFGKSKVRTGKDVIGALIRAKTAKSRLSKEEQQIEILLNYDTGLDRWHYMDTFAIAAGVFKKEGKMLLVIDSKDGKEKKKFATAIMKDPERYFNEDVMAKIEEFVNTNFQYGSPDIDLLAVEESVDVD
ncbi:MAG: hypothetical protein QM489_00780 [Candidatus Izemoplasma sp.]